MMEANETPNTPTPTERRPCDALGEALRQLGHPDAEELVLLDVRNQAPVVAILATSASLPEFRTLVRECLDVWARGGDNDVERALAEWSGYDGECLVCSLGELRGDDTVCADRCACGEHCGPCPVGDTDCEYGDGHCHDACEAPDHEGGA